MGGHQRWHSKIKQAYPSIRTITPDEVNLDFSFLANKDIVCFETTYSNHSIYHKALSELNETDVTLHYFNGQRNVYQLAKELHNIKIAWTNN